MKYYFITYIYRVHIKDFATETMQSEAIDEHPLKWLKSCPTTWIDAYKREYENGQSTILIFYHEITEPQYEEYNQ